jgi:hypothetical protein
VKRDVPEIDIVAGHSEAAPSTPHPAEKQPAAGQHRPRKEKGCAVGGAAGEGGAAILLLALALRRRAARRCRHA